MADGAFKFTVDAADAEKRVKSLADLVDQVADDMDSKHVVDVDTSDAKSALSELADLAKKAFAFEALGAAGDFLGGIAEKGGELAGTYKILSAQTGLLGDELDALKDRGAAAFRDGLGENIAESTKLIGQAQTTLGQFLDPAGVDAFTKRMGGVQKTFDVEVNESIEKSRSAIAAWGLSGDEAANLVTIGLQKAKTPSNDFLDTLAEYSPLMKEAGFSANEFTSTLVKAGEAGAFSLDKVADAAKETQIRLKAGDISTSLSEITSPITAAIEGIVKAGEQGKISTKEVLQSSAEAIETAFDAGQISESVRSKLQVAISGTPAEELGTELYSKVFGAPVDEAAFKSLASKTGAAFDESIGPSMLESISRSLSGIGDQAAAFFAPIAGPVSEILGLVGSIGPAIAVLLPAFGGVAGIMGTVATAAGAMWTAITGPVGLVVLAVAAIVGVFVLAYNQSEAFRNAIDELWAGIKEFVSGVWERVKPVLETVWGLIKEIAVFIYDVVIAYFKLWWNAISAVVSAVGDLISGLFGASDGASFFSKVLDALGSVMGKIKLFIDYMRVGIAALAAAFKAAFEVIGEIVSALVDLDFSAIADAASGFGEKVSTAYIDAARAKMRELAAANNAVIADTVKESEQPARDAGGKVGTAFGDGVKSEAAKALATTVSGLEGLISEKFERGLRNRIAAVLRGVSLTAEEISTTILDTGIKRDILGNYDEILLLTTRFENDKLRIEEGFRAKREAIEKQIKAGLDAKRLKEARQALADYARLQSEALANLDTELQAQLGALRARLEQDKIVVPVRVALEAIALPAAVDPAEEIRKRIAALRSANEAEIARLRESGSSVLAEWLEEGFPAQIAGLEQQLADLTGVASGFTSTLETQLLAGEALWRSYYDSVDVSRQQSVRSELEAIRTEEDELALSIARRGRMTEEDAERRIALAKERAEKERELEKETANVGVIALRGSLTALAGLGDGFRANLDEQLKLAKDHGTNIEDLLAAAAGGIVAIGAEAALASQDIFVATATAAIDATLKILLANQAAYLFNIFGTTIGELGPIGGPLAFAVLAAALGSLGAIAKAALQEAKPVKREAGGLIEGGMQYLVNDDPHQRPEWLVDWRSTQANMPLLEFMKSNPGTDLSGWVRSVARESIAHDMADRQRLMQRAAENERTSLDLKELTREVHAMRGDVSQQTDVVRQGIAIRGESTLEHRHIRQSYESERRRTGALR